MTNAADVLLTAIADSVVKLVAARSETATYVCLQAGPGHKRGKGMLGVMSVAILGEASLAEVKVVTCLAVNEFGLGQVCNAAVAGAQGHLVVRLDGRNDARVAGAGRRRRRRGERSPRALGLSHALSLGLDLILSLGLGQNLVCSRQGGLLDLGLSGKQNLLHLNLSGLERLLNLFSAESGKVLSVHHGNACLLSLCFCELLRVNFARLGVNGDNRAIIDEALGQFVTIVVADDTFVETVRAKVKIAVVADGAVVMFVGDGTIAAVTADCKTRPG